ncbi:MAG: hemolysin family protein [Actinomycetota bacterium]|nr:hemolysin family protein [Actinomycetota bacterium]
MAAEFAFVRIRATQVDRLVREGKSTAGMVKTARRKLDAYLAVCQLGITISSLGLGALGEPVVAALIEPLLGPLGVPEGLIHTLAFAIAFGIISFFHVVFGELAPKTVAIQSPEGTSLFVAPFMRFFYYLLLPGTIVFNGTANAFTRALGYPPASESDETHSEEEIRQLVAQSTRHGVLDEDEEEMVGAVFELNDKVAREIMVPRPDVVSLQAEMDLRKLVSVAAAGTYTRYPVYEDGSPDRIVGAVHVKDVLRAVESGGGLEADITARDLMRDVLIVPENRPIDGILEDFQKQELQMAIVIDEWGSFEGLFTLEDIIEEIVGEIRDEFDEEEPAVRKLPDGSYSMDGRIPIGVVNEALGSEFESEDFDTIGGLVLGHLGRAPEVGDEVRLDGYLLRVDEVDGPRVAQVIAREAPEDDAPEPRPPEE